MLHFVRSHKRVHSTNPHDDAIEGGGYRLAQGSGSTSSSKLISPDVGAPYLDEMAKDADNNKTAGKKKKPLPHTDLPGTSNE